MFEKTMQRLSLGDERGVAIISVVAGIAIGGAIAYFIVATLLNGLERSSFTASDNTTFDSFKGNVNTGFVILGLLIIVVIGGAILKSL